jgi:hypothetical protein
MFAMPTKQRVLLCRLGFVLLCVLPTLAVCLWIVGQSTASPVREAPDSADWAQILSSRLGLVVECNNCASLDDGTLLLTGLRLLDPETREVLVTSAAITARRDALNWRVEAQGVRIDLADSNRLTAALHERLLCGPASEFCPLSLAARDVLLHSGTHPQTGPHTQTLTTLDATLELAASGPQVLIECSLPGNESDAGRARLTISRNRRESTPVTGWEFDTAGQQWPCWIAAAWFPSVKRLGESAQFTGRASIARAAGGSFGHLSGTLDGVDLDSLVTEQFPHQLSGLGRVEVERAAIEDGKLVDLRGRLIVESGALGASLLAAAQEHLKLRLAVARETEGTQAVVFQRLALAFHHDGRWLRLSSCAELSPPGVILSDRRGPLVEVAAGHTVPATNLLRALVPDNQYQVPATRQTDALVGLLPAPDLAPTRTALAPAHMPMRLRGSGPHDAAPVLRQPGLR